MCVYVCVYVLTATLSYTSSSSSCRAGSTDIPDPLSPLFPIVHRLWQVFRCLEETAFHFIG